MQIAESTQIIGWGADSRPENRPGYPKEVRPPRPIGEPHWITPDQQRHRKPSVLDPHRGMTPVYGTAVPPRLLSGVIRRLAYRMPSYQARRWMLLVLSDRIDVIEHTIIPAALKAGVVAAVGASLLIGLRALRER